MTPTPVAPAATPVPARHPALTRPFARHLVEMVLAMLVGMIVLGPLWVLPPRLADRADVASFVMATNMTVAMAVWMWHRGHRGAAIGEMSAAMYAPFVVLVPPWWAGLVSADVVLLLGHVLMLPAMIVAMLHRVPEYAVSHARAPRAGAFNRWPTVLALLVTLDNLVEPRPMSPWTLLLLAFGYLVIGAVRHTLRPATVLRRQLVVSGAYLALIAAALLAPAQLGLYLMASGWLAHAVWDWWHHRRHAVVPRAFAEWCAGFDALIGVSLIAVALGS